MKTIKKAYNNDTSLNVARGVVICLIIAFVVTQLKEKMGT